MLRINFSFCHQSAPPYSTLLLSHAAGDASCHRAARAARRPPPPAPPPFLRRSRRVGLAPCQCLQAAWRQRPPPPPELPLCAGSFWKLPRRLAERSTAKSVLVWHSCRTDGLRAAPRRVCQLSSRLLAEQTLLRAALLAVCTVFVERPSWTDVSRAAVAPL
ncbi:hypothetical protein R5R35_013164 [Gryllus longicercus]|uniref:Uncharacterized protein n=1 Tax=Gryllus longicercus TaxID=2509291 RepID=A0AAN9V5V7_9ORTH